jgi:ribosomal protein S18 acetylase RimI-like enzyme
MTEEITPEMPHPPALVPTPVFLRPLHDDDFDAVHTAFVEAFSDYSVKLQLAPEQLREMLTRRGWSPERSIAALDGERMVGFTLNGIGTWQGQPATYDTGTGVIPSHRGRGLSRAMFEALLPTLRDGGITQYLLEVLATNDTALALYRSLGFNTTRMFQCWSYAIAAEPRQEIREVAPDWPLFETWLDVAPSWQNSTDSIRRSRSPHAILGAFDEGRLVGYAVVYLANGDLPQLAVAPSHRRRGFGTALLRAAWARVGMPLRVLNVEENAAEVCAFLEAAGAERTVRQHEMLLKF